ncbi:MAG: Crp/Fnr family transcriptional regulator [Sediminibacterium sp.]|nr:Crp/Fnr family transcriptional regulator [Sediminibacterium sp.]
MTSPLQIDCKSCAYKSSCIYDVLKGSEKELLNKGKVVNIYRKGEIIYKEGSAATSCFFVQEGALKLSKETLSDKPFFITLRKSGTTIGMESLNNHSNYESTAQCITDITCCALTSRMIYSLIQKSRAACSFLAFQYNDFISDLYTHLTIMSTEKANVRIARSLLTLLEVGKGKLANIRIEDLAAISGTTRETTSRALSRMKTNKIISVSNREINILDEQKLKNFIQ